MKVEHEPIARRLLDEGYTRAVVARKLIDIHGMNPDEAELLVERLTGTKVDAYAGDTLTTVTIGVTIGTVCLAASAFLYVRLPSELGQLEWWAHGILWSTAGASFTKAFIAFMNRDVRPGRR